MKRNVKILLACAVSLMLVTTAVAAYYIWSNIVTITPSIYLVKMDTPTQLNSTTIRLSGNLTKDDVGFVGETVSLYNCAADGATKTFIANVTTVDAGIFSYDWQGFTVGIQYWFIAGYQVLP